MTAIPTDAVAASLDIAKSIMAMLSRNGHAPSKVEAQDMADRVCEGTSEAWTGMVKSQVSLLVLKGTDHAE